MFAHLFGGQFNNTINTRCKFMCMVFRCMFQKCERLTAKCSPPPRWEQLVIWMGNYFLQCFTALVSILCLSRIFGDHVQLFCKLIDVEFPNVFLDLVVFRVVFGGPDQNPSSADFSAISG